MLYIYFVLLFVSVISCLPSRHEIIKLPLIKHQPTLSKRSSKLYNQQNIEYLVKLKIGTPSQEFLVSIDTGSSDLWVPSTSCPTSDCPYTKFNVIKSNTFQEANISFTIQYGSGSIHGDYVQDKVQLNDKISISDQTFGLATFAKNGILSKATQSNGILGLGFPALTANSDTNEAYLPFVFNLYKQGVIKDPVFSISLANEEMQIGSDGGLSGIHYVDAIKNVNPKTNTQDYTFWSIQLNSIHIENRAVDSKTHSVILDTGTTMSYMTQAIVEDMLTLANISFNLDKNTHLYKVKCDARNTDKVVRLGLANNVQLDLAVKDLIMSLDGGDHCLFGFTFGFDASDSFVFGDSVLKSTHLVFDFGQHRVGMASALHSAIQSAQ